VNRIYFALAASALFAMGQAQAFHPCGSYTYHYRVHGHGVGGTPAGLAPQSFSFVQPQAQSFSFVQPQAQSFSLVPQAQSFSLVLSNGSTNAGSQAVNQNDNTAGGGGTAAEAQALSPALLAALRIACNLVGSNVGGGNNNSADITALTNEVRAMRGDQKAILAELKAINGKLSKSPELPGEKKPEPKKKPGQDPNTSGNKTSVEAPCEFAQLREQAERLASESAKAEVVVKVSK